MPVPNLRNIDYPKMLYECLREYFSINSSEEVSILYKYLACFIAPFVVPFNNYYSFRAIEVIIANCKWQIGQLTNVLNNLYDSTLRRIYITQSTVTSVGVPEFVYNTGVFPGEFGETIQTWIREFNDPVSISTVTINVPVSANLSAITAAVNQIRLQGIPFAIATF